jgi:DNA-binding PadR family transcriptional regulator
MSLDNILLGLLREPASGYDLKVIFDRSIRYFWAAELSQIYPTLQRMQKKGLLTSKLERSTKGPRRRVYSLTAAGRKVLRDWVRGDPQLGDERYGFVAQFFFLDAAGDWSETRRYVKALRTVLAARLETYRKIEADWLARGSEFPDPDSPAGFHQYMALRGGLHHLTARITWCDDVLKRVDSLARRSNRPSQSKKPKTKRNTRRSNG